MTITKTYRCNLCSEVNDPDRLRGLYWQSTVTVPELVERPARGVEHHICDKCLDALRSFEPRS